MSERETLIAEALRAMADCVERITPRNVIDLVLDGELLTLEQAADVADCSDEKIRKACKLAAKSKLPLGVTFAGRWFVGKARLLDRLEQGKIDRRRGPDARREAEERARKYEAWARPQKPLNSTEGAPNRALP